MTYREAMRKARRDYLLGVLNEAKGSVSQAARLAGCNRTHFYKLLKAAGLQRRTRTYGNSEWRALH